MSGRKLLAYPPLLYSGLLLLWLAGWALVGERWWVITLLSRYNTLLFQPAPVLGLLALLTRRPRVIAVALVPALVFGAFYWPYYLPHPAPAGTPALRVMTYNVLFTNRNPDAVARAIRAYQPDLIALQEVQPTLMQALRTALAPEYPYSFRAARNPYGTTAVFSRHPFSVTESLDLQADRPAALVHLTVEGRTVLFASAHLLPVGGVPSSLDVPARLEEHTRLQTREVATLLAALAAPTDIVLLGCDCNAKEPGDTIRLLAGALRNAAHETGWLLGGLSLPGAEYDRNPDHIDYVWYRGPLVPLGVYAGSDHGHSDHAPIIAVFAWP